MKYINEIYLSACDKETQEVFRWFVILYCLMFYGAENMLAKIWSPKSDCQADKPDLVSIEIDF